MEVSEILFIFERNILFCWVWK